MEVGPTAGGRYTRPLRFYLGLCGILMVMLFLSGGAKQLMIGLPPEMLQQMADRSGKSLELFLAHADGWISLVLVPVMSGFYALSVAPLLKLWNRTLSWAHAFRATFVFLNAWTILLLPFGFMAYKQGPQALISLCLTLVFLAASFIRMGRGLWWRTWPGAVVKMVVLAFSVFVLAGVGMYPVLVIGLLGALFGG